MLDTKTPAFVRAPLYKQFKELLKGRLRSQKQWIPGAKIPPERWLSEEFRISRVTVAKALSELEAEGVLERRPPGGTFLTQKAACRGYVRLLCQTSQERDAICPGYAIVLATVEEELSKAGFALTYASRIGLEPVKSTGTVLLGPFPADQIQALGAQQPLVTVDCGAHFDGLDGVEIDNVSSAEQATLWLARRGHKRIAYWGAAQRPTEPSLNSEARREGYRRSLAAAGLQPMPELEYLAWPRFPEARELGRTMLDQHPRTTAVLACSKELGAGAIAAARECGVTAPKFEVVSFGDQGDELPDAVGHAALVRVPWREMGKAAAERLLKRLDGSTEPPQHIRMVPHLGVALNRVGSLFPAS